MNKEVYKEMCSQIYEGESWDRMINCLERKDKEIERQHSIIKEVREYIDKEYEENCIIVDYCDNPITPQDLYSDILEILDKESEN